LGIKDENIGIFTRLGLTNRQAEVYLTIFKLGQTTAGACAKTMQIARAEIYRAISTLEKIGLVKRVIASPTIFRAIPIADGLSILLQRNAEKHEENCRHAKHFLRNFINNREKPSQEDYQYTLTSGFKAESREFEKALLDTQTSADGILLWRDVQFSVNRTFKIFRKLVKRGVKFRCITNISEDEKLPQTIQTLKKTGSFEMRFASTVPTAGINILDRKKVEFIIVPQGDYSKMQVLRSNDPALVDLAQDYFELKWQSATARAGSGKKIK
jgi:sugar-specific transcriptional regulator TrmB